MLLEASLQDRERKLPEHSSLERVVDTERFLECAHREFPRKHGLFQRRFEDGLICYGLWHRQTLVGYVWFAAGRYFEPLYRYTFRPRRHEVYQFDGFVQGGHREGMLSLQTLVNIHCDLRKQGYERCIALCSLNDTRNLKMHAFLGFTEMGRRIVTHTVLRFPFTRASTYDERLLPRRKRARAERAVAPPVR